MPRVDQLYSALLKDVSVEATEVLAEGLLLADPESAVRIAEILVERRSESAWMALACRYCVLPTTIREKMSRRADWLTPGLSAALRRPEPELRCNALELLAAHPRPELAYRAAECVADASPAVREVAQRTLVRLAETGLGAAPEVRRQLASALRDTLRIFERHRSAEVLRAALWYAAEIEDDLWRVLGAVNGTAPQVVSRSLKDWADPRLSGFLLLALAQQNWHRAAQDILSQWDSRECGLAVISRLDLLARVDVRQSLHRVRSPRWFIAVVSSLDGLTAAQVAALPLWVRHLGFPDSEKWHCLDAWAVSRRPELQLGAVHTIAAINDERALNALDAAATRGGPAGTFARWALLGRQVWAERAAQHRRRRAAVPGG